MEGVVATNEPAFETRKQETAVPGKHFFRTRSPAQIPVGARNSWDVSSPQYLDLASAALFVAPLLYVVAHSPSHILKIFT